MLPLAGLGNSLGRQIIGATKMFKKMIVLYSHKDFRHKDVERILMYKKCKNTMSKTEFCMCLQYTEYSLKANSVLIG